MTYSSRGQAILCFLNDVEPLCMHGFMLTLNGAVLAEGYWKPWSAKRPHRMYSVSKSCVSLGIGLLADDGVLSLDDRIVSCFPEQCGAVTPDMLSRVTIRDMLRMTTCYDRAMYAPLDDADWTAPFFHGTPTHVPGTVFSYDTSASQVLCALIERLAGCSILSFLEKRLFGPLGMNGEKRWLKDGMGVSQGGTGLVMTLRDFSKLAQFCMSDGGGLLHASYLHAATHKQVETNERSGFEERFGYGYQFWRMRRGFSMYGLGGQMALCLPEAGLCLCTTADLTMDAAGVQPIYDAFFRHLEHIAALPENKADAAALQQKIDGLMMCPPTASRVERSFSVSLTQGTLPFHGLEITPEAVRFAIGEETYALPYASGQWAQGIFPTTQEECLTSGGAASPERFRFRCGLWGNTACGMELFVALKGDLATVRVVSSLREVVRGWGGQDWGVCTPC